MQLSENVDCYASVQQREVLIQLADHPLVNKSFFLTGGTALSVFYLHHRTSEDLDLFTVDDIELSEIPFWIGTVWPAEHVNVRLTRQFLSMLIRGVKVDFVVDSMSGRGKRERAVFDGKSMMIDSLENIGANKLCTIVSRTEPKDFVDFYFFSRNIPELSFDRLFELARKREALFDDLPTAAFQLEDGLRFIREHEQLIPQLKKPIDLQEMVTFYNDCARRLYQMGRA